ncbi:MMPL family transporter, partial [Mycobacterium sp. NPDC003449]
INTGIIRAMGGSGKVVTAAGLVFAFTMMSMVASDLRIIGQVGSTIGIGLLLDTLVVRALMTPSIAALLGRWFWWPQRVRRRPARWQPVAVRSAPRPGATAAANPRKPGRVRTGRVKSGHKGRRSTHVGTITVQPGPHRR